MRFSGRDAILFNFRSRFTDLSATRARVSFRSVPKLRLWVLVCGCSVLRMMYISKATEILSAGDLPAQFDMQLPRE